MAGPKLVSKSRRFRPGRLAGFGAAAVVTVVLGATLAVQRYPLDRVTVYEDPEENFKYGSIAADTERGLPVRVLQVLPRLFPEYLPEGAPQDFTAFGFIQEPGRPMPIGWSQRHMIVPRVGLNCAGCHTGIIRTSETAEPTVILGMPAVQLDIRAMFSFLFQVAADERFNADFLLPEMAKDGPLNMADRMVYRWVIGALRDGVIEQRDETVALFSDDMPRWGPGRVDTFNPYKVMQLKEHYLDGLPEEEAIGTAAYMSLWNQGARVALDMALNWDGNAPSVHDRNVGAAFGAGATRESVDIASLDRVQSYVNTLAPPAYPFPVDAELAQRGSVVYENTCASCHSLQGNRIGLVEPLDSIGTDPERAVSYTERLNQLLLDYGEGYDWKLTRMRSTGGYVNMPLDGIWARAPYLHNGSVPTMWDLLQPEDERNDGQPTFWIGHAVLDPVKLGHRTDIQELNGRRTFLFDVRLRGNSNRGHSGAYYGTELSDADKWALIEYLKTL